MDETPPTILERMTGAGIGEDRARGHLVDGRVRVEGETVTDPDRPAPPPARWVVAGQ